MGTIRVRVDNDFVLFDDRFSYKDFTNVPFIDIPDGTNVIGSCFYQPNTDSTPFRKDMKNVTFYYCNLDNVIFEDESNRTVGGKQRRLKVMNDLRDWVVDERDEPIKLAYEKGSILRGESTDVRDIPAEKIADATKVPKRL